MRMHCFTEQVCSGSYQVLSKWMECRVLLHRKDVMKPFPSPYTTCKSQILKSLLHFAVNDGSPLGTSVGDILWEYPLEISLAKILRK
jgi:hypothetical protein